MVTHDYSGRVAVITGAAKGIGLAIAQRLSASGAAVAIWDMDATRMEQAKAEIGGDKVLCVQVDVTDDASVDKAAAETEREFGRIDILVNSAGIAGPNFKTWEYPVDEWRKVIDIDLNGTLDVVFSCENARGKSGIMWLSRRKSQPSTSANWLAHEISGRKQGVKFDRIELVDFDGDGDFDVLTCEEHHINKTLNKKTGLGVFWYENPR